jgi:hypothetical protein
MEFGINLQLSPFMHNSRPDLLHFPLYHQVGNGVRNLFDYIFIHYLVKLCLGDIEPVHGLAKPLEIILHKTGNQQSQFFADRIPVQTTHRDDKAIFLAAQVLVDQEGEMFIFIHQLMVIGYWLLVVRYWLLVTGY